MSLERSTTFLVGPAGLAPTFNPTRGNVKLDRDRAVTYIRRGPDRGVTASGVLISKYRTTWEIPMMDVATLTLLLDTLSDTGLGSPWTFHRPGNPRLLDALISTEDGLNFKLSGGLIQDLGFSLDAKSIAVGNANVAWQGGEIMESAPSAGSDPLIDSVTSLLSAVTLDGESIPCGSIKFTLMRDLEPAGWDSTGKALSVRDHGQVDVVGSLVILDYPGAEELTEQLSGDLVVMLSNGVNTLTLTSPVRLRSAGRVAVGTNQTGHAMEFLGIAPFNLTLT